MFNLIVGIVAAAAAVGTIITLTVFAVHRIDFMNREGIFSVRELYRKRNSG